MSKEPITPRFGPGCWVTIRGTGEHVKIEAWSRIAAAYRVHSRKHGLFFAGDDEVLEVVAHPEVDRGKYWTRCPAPGCGAPLTPELVICARCQTPTCGCGRCCCVRTPSVVARAKPARKRATSKGR
jgi:hypothetical protein